MRTLDFKVHIVRTATLVLVLLLLLQCVPARVLADDAAQKNPEAVSASESEEADSEPAEDETEPEEETEPETETELTEEELEELEALEEETDEGLNSYFEDDDFGDVYYAGGRFFPDYTLEEYGSVRYASGTILDNGCSVTCMASLATYMTGHQYYPDELAGYFGSSCDNNVQRLSYMADMLEIPYTMAKDYRDVLAAVKEGKVVIQLMNSKSLFTKSQHFILIRGMKANGLLDVYDPSQKNRDSWYLREKLLNGFTTDEICWGYDGAWIFDPSKMPEDPYIYEPPVRAYVEPRYDGLQLTEEETKLLAQLIWVEARGENAQGQQAIAEVVLNRYTSGLFGKNLSVMINDEDAFVKRKFLKSAKPGQAQYEAIDRALYGPYVLPKEVLFYGKVRTTQNVWGTIGGHIFCYPNDYSVDKSDRN